MLVSLHLPKTAGTSFLASLKDYYKEAILLDYADVPINTPVLKRRISAFKHVLISDSMASDLKCVHGHFLPLKYLRMDNAKYITWLRDPIERIASHYFYWLRSYRPGRSSQLHYRVVEEEWSFERFCMSSELRNLYSEFLWGFPISKFDFIGITEHYNSDMKYFSNQFLGCDLPVFKKNSNEDSVRKGYFSDNFNFRREVEDFHRKDVQLYKKALILRGARL